MKYIGAHVSISGGVENAPLNAAAIGAKAFAMFTKNQRQWKSPPLTAKSIEAFKKNCEDNGFTADQILFDNNIRYCDAAIFYDEQPTSMKIMWRQRVRWSRGHLLVFYARFKELFASLFKKETRHWVSLYDITVYILPSPIIMLILQAVQLTLLLTAPLVDENVTMQQVIFGSTANFWYSDGLLFSWIKSTLISLASMLLMAALIFIIERKRIHGVSFMRKVLITLCWPLFLLIQLPMDVQALFSRHLGWKPIPHKDQTKFENVNSPAAEEIAE